MKFGIFDHVDRSDLVLSELLDKRLEYVKAVEAAGFYSYHVAEHHATPLNLVPVPGVYLGAVANATSTIRLGPLVYLLPLYSPLRLIEEISIFKRQFVKFLLIDYSLKLILLICYHALLNQNHLLVEMFHQIFTEL